MQIFIAISSVSVKDKIFKSNLSNPGIGGTEYLSVVLGIALSEEYKDLKITIVTDNRFEVETVNKNFNIIIGDVREIFNKNELGDGYWILTRASAQELKLSKENCQNKKIALWSHHPSDWRCFKYKKLVDFFVSTGEYQYISNYHYFKKNIKIGNLYYRQNTDIEKTKKAKKKTFDILFLGALIPAKGFHHVLKHWNKIITEVPNAVLHVIGGSKLYGIESADNQPFPCDASYANTLSKIIINQKIDLSKVIFYGSCGEERFKIYKDIDVAIINPTGQSESFSFNLHECLDFGIPTICSNDYGLNDTMSHFKELSILSPGNIIEKILYLKSSDEIYKEISNKSFFYISQYNLRNKNNLSEWYSLFANNIQYNKYKISNTTHMMGILRSLIGRLKYIYATVTQYFK